MLNLSPKVANGYDLKAAHWKDSSETLQCMIFVEKYCRKYSSVYFVFVEAWNGGL